MEQTKKINDKLQARVKLIEMYKQSLKEDKIPWIQEWATKSKPYNPVSKTKYHGINNLLLNIVSEVLGYSDPRWCTFNQIKNNGWKLDNAKGKGIPIEYWMPFDKVNNKFLTWPQYKELVEKNEDISQISLYCKTSFVFNAKFISGIPPLENKFTNNYIYSSPFIQNLIKNLGVEYKEFGDEAYYSLKKDMVVIPEQSLFNSNYAYYSTQLHELSHSTGHENRLNRSMNNVFGSPEYAKEELRAEIASSFLAQELDIQCKDEYLNNHKAYIQDWIEILENNPDELFKAIKDAEKIQDYALKVGEWEKVQEQINTTSLYQTILSQLKKDKEYANSLFRIEERLKSFYENEEIGADVYQLCLDERDTVFEKIANNITSFLSEPEIEKDFKNKNYEVITAMILNRKDLYFDAIINALDIDDLHQEFGREL